MADGGQVQAPNAVHPQVVAKPPPPPSRVSADRVAEIVLKLVAAEHDRDQALRDIERLTQERDHARAVAERLERSFTQTAAVLTIQEQAASATGDRLSRTLEEVDRLLAEVVRLSQDGEATQMVQTPAGVAFVGDDPVGPEQSARSAWVCDGCGAVDVPLCKCLSHRWCGRCHSAPAPAGWAEMPDA